jgi:hypothetical protein
VLYLHLGVLFGYPNVRGEKFVPSFGREAECLGMKGVGGGLTEMVG